MSAESNKATALDLIERVLNQHDLEALEEFTSNPAVVAAGRGLVSAFRTYTLRCNGRSLKATWWSCSTMFGAHSKVRGYSCGNRLN